MFSGIKTGNNEAFLRFWFEVTYTSICLNPQIKDESSLKWRFYNKGGGYKKWYGGYENVINFANNGKEIKDKIDKNTYRLRDPQNYYKEAIIWPLIGDVRFSARIMPSYVLSDVASNTIFTDNQYLLAFMNSVVFNEAIKYINSTVSYPIDSVENVPFILDNNDSIRDKTLLNVDISKKDWDSFETSWDFKKHPLI